MRKLVAFSSGTLLLGCAAAGFGADIVGTIVNPAGAPIPEVTVLVQSLAGTAVGASVSDGTGKYAIHGLAPGTYTLIAEGQTAVAYVGDRGITVDWGIAASSEIIAVGRAGTAAPFASVSAKSLMKDLVAKHFDAGNIDGNDSAVQRGDCTKDEDDGDGDGTETATNAEPSTKGRSRRHCKPNESD